MATATHYPHLSFDANGIAHIGETRYKVSHLAGEHYHYGWSAEELLRQHPDLRPEEVYAALTYFYDHFNLIVPLLNASNGANSQAAPQTSGLTRAELLGRKLTRGE